MVAVNRAPIEFREYGLAGILKQYRLQVPRNQREYAWTKSEVSQLFIDIRKAIEEDSAEYFLGTVVTIPREPDLLEVVDGQQRLATTAILLAEIRHYLKQIDSNLANSIDNEFLLAYDRKKREPVVKLQLNIDDNEFFRGMISAQKDSDRPILDRPTSHKLIHAAFAESRKWVRTLTASKDGQEAADTLVRWIAFLEHDAHVILLKVPTGANAYKMFETLNDRGLKTSQADLVKNYLFQQAGDDREAEAQQKWNRIRATLETLDEDDITVTFLRQAMIAIRGHLKESEVYEAVQAKAKGPTSAIQFLASLEGLAIAYVALFNPEHEKWNKYPDAMRRAIETLNLLNIRSMRPLMLAVAATFKPVEASEAFRSFITWGVRLIIAATTSRGAIEERLASAAFETYTAKIDTANSLKQKLKDQIPSNEEFKNAVETTTVSKAAFARYYLRSLEMAAKNESAPWFIPNNDRETINLEHILPESPGPDWPEFDDETHGLYFRRLGNLALLTAKSNSDLKSVKFSQKKVVYAKSPYSLTKQIATVDKWTKISIIERQKSLADLALKAWPL